MRKASPRKANYPGLVIEVVSDGRVGLLVSQTPLLPGAQLSLPRLAVYILWCRSKGPLQDSNRRSC